MSYEERAANALDAGGTSAPAMLRGIGFALLALGEKVSPDREYRYGAQPCKFCGDTYGDLTDHYITTTKDCGRMLAAMLNKAHGSPA